MPPDICPAYSYGQIDLYVSSFIFMFTINFTLRDSTGRITDYFETTCTGNNSCVPDPEAGKLYYICYSAHFSGRLHQVLRFSGRLHTTVQKKRQRQRHILYLK